ncbi:MAG: dCTP deaminase [Xanthobacteraceae bacterium]|nr:dCTP deaminase [Xanthobacteraceae bacterium]
MLSSDEILARISCKEDDPQRLCIVPDPSERIGERSGASVDLRLGRWFKSFKQTRTKFVSLAGPAAAPRTRSKRSASSDEVTSTEASRTREHFVPFGQSYVLHPGRFVLGATLEWIKFPATLAGYVTGKSGIGRHGLVIETAAGIHPFFSGCLTLELANIGEVPLEIFPGMEICQVFFHRTAEVVDPKPGKFSGSRKPGLRTPKADAIFERLREGN